MFNNYAGFFKRLGAFLIDCLILAPVIAVINAIFPGRYGGNAFASLLVMIAEWLYFALMESSEMQATLGKRALSIIVTDLSGNRISFARASGRFFSKILSAIIILIGYIMAAFTERKQALHDMMAGTLVLEARRAHSSVGGSNYSGNRYSQPDPSGSDRLACPSCGAYNARGAVFCASCGARLVPDKAGGPTSCPNCGVKIEPGCTFCPNCGNMVSK